MRSRRFGRVVFITSLAARQPIAGLALSNALRAGVLGYAKTLSDEVARDGVTVNSVCPGYTRTERLAELAAEVARSRAVTPEEVYAGWERLAAMGRLGRPEELGEVVAFLASERASFLTGVALPVDGGASRALF
jgi:3-oxoacyl-[acyl-carrier protein] reductase